MTVRLTDPKYGHTAVFYAKNAKYTAASDVTWGSSSIEVPSHSCLNGVADVWLRLSPVSLYRAAAWCCRANVTYLGLWQGPESTSLGFGFRVPHFSRFRFDDSDEDDDVDNGDLGGEDDAAGDDKEASATRRARLRQAGSTPAHPRASTVEDSASRQARLRQAGSTPAHPRVGAIEDSVSRQARLRQAGSTPARPRVSANRSSALDDEYARDASSPLHHAVGAPPPTPATVQRPRMSTRAIADLDDTDPDLDEDEDSIQPDDDSLLRPLPSDLLPRRNFLDADPLNYPLAVHDYPSHTYEDSPGAFQPVQQWSTALGVDAPKVHRLREALFTPTATDLIDIEPDERDVIMTDSAAAAEKEFYADKLSSISNSYDEIEDFPSGDPENAACREADDFVDRDAPISQPLVDTFGISVLPFPKLNNSVVAGKHGVMADMGLVLGRSSRTCVSSGGQMYYSLFNSINGFGVGIKDRNSSVDWYQRLAFSQILARHCAVWYGSTSSVGLPEPHMPIDPDTDVRRQVRMPTLYTAFRSGTVADDVMSQTIEQLWFMHLALHDTNSQHASIAFGMLLALYKSGGDDENDEQSNLLHRLAIWAKGPAGTAFDKNAENLEGLRKAVVLLAIGKVDEAVDVAIELGHMRLALLMSRSLEAPKDELRNDAEGQLEMYGLRVHRNDDMAEDSVGRSPDDVEWDQILTLCTDNANVSVDERMILLILAGHVAPVARYLGFSWYRLFIMELLHGAGSSNEAQWQRVAASVKAVSSCEKISTFAPHVGSVGKSTVSTMSSPDTDVVYQLLQMYTADGDKNTLTSGLYCNSSFGVTEQPMDYRFSWLLHQVLSALIPEASPRSAGMVLADGLAAQLKDCGLVLWAYYVLCCGGASADVLKSTLLRDWPKIRMDGVEVKMNADGTTVEPDQDPIWGVEDFEAINNEGFYTNAEDFLTFSLAVPQAWICEAKAIAARVEGNRMEECEQWLKCHDENGSIQCHRVLMSQLIPDAIVINDKDRLNRIYQILSELETMGYVSSWPNGGGLILRYLRHVHGIPDLVVAGFETLHDMARCVQTYVERAKSDAQRCAGTIVADGIVTAQRALLMRVAPDVREKWFMTILSDLDMVHCSRAVRLRLTAEYTLAATHGWPNAQRIAAAFPAYQKYLEAYRDDAQEGNNKDVLVQ